MERGAKRKAAAVSATPIADARPAKRRKSHDVHDPYYIPDTGETPASTTEVGTRFIEQMKRAKDKHDRIISTHFLTLPNKKQHPLYYEQTQMPIAIETLEGKLERNEYPNLTTLESDVKRMVGNAKAFNETGSEIYLDAERIRKMTSNFMVKWNPAYKDGDYVAFATPIPPQQPKAQTPDTDAGAPATLKISRRSDSAVVNGAQEGAEEADGDFTGKTFQQAQNMIVNEIIKYKDESELEIFQPFVNLPSRTLTDYYNVIKQPTSLKGILKKIHGVHGRYETTGVTDLKTWDAFENEVKKIWDNARAYNEDGSDLFALAGELEDHFKKRLLEAKKLVEEPSQPTLKLNLGAKPHAIKIRLGSSKASPAPQAHQQTASPSATPGVSVDQRALQRQKDMVDAGMHGNKPAQGTHSNSPAIAIQPSPMTAVQGTLSRIISGSASSPATVNGIKTEHQANQTLTIGTQGSGGVAPITASMPPPSNIMSTLARPLINSTSSLTNGTSYTPQAPPHPAPHVPYHAPSTGLDNKWRPEGKDATTALLTNLTITTHPDLPLLRPLFLTLPPSSTLSHQSITLNLPSTHSILQIEPTLSTALVAKPAAPPSTTPGMRPYKLFLTANGQRVPSNYLPGTSRWQYDVKLVPGVNRIEVECVSAAVKGLGLGLGYGMGAGAGAGFGVPQGVAGGRTAELELERVSIFAHLMRVAA